jgi:hypothetical protein
MTSVAAIGELLQEPGVKVLFVASHSRAALRVLAAFPGMAARLSQTTDATRVTVAGLTDKVGELGYDVAVLDIRATCRTNRGTWVRFIEVNNHLEDVRIAFSLDQHNMSPGFLSTVRRDAVATAKEVGAKVAHAFGGDDQKIHAIRARNRQSWDTAGFWSGLRTLDVSAGVKIVDAFKGGIEMDATALWIQEARQTKRVKDLEAWAGRTLTDGEVESELKMYALTTLRGGYDLAWAGKNQWAELHDPDEEDIRVAGYDVYAEDRRDVASRVLHMHEILGAAIAGLVVVGARVSASAADSVAAARRARALFQRERYRVLKIVAKRSSALRKRMLDTPTPAKRQTRQPGKKQRRSGPTIRFITTVLAAVGYTRAGGPRRVQENGVRMRVYDFDPAVPVPCGTYTKESEGGGTGLEPGFSADPEAVASTSYIYPLYKDVLATSQNPAETGVEPEYRPLPSPPAGTQPGFQVDLGRWDQAGSPADKGDGHDRATPYLTVPKFTVDGILFLPEPGRRRPSSTDKLGRCYGRWPGTTTLVQSLSGSHRHLLRALPGRTLLNFDFSNAHPRIAAKFAAPYDTRKEFAALASSADVYATLAAGLGVDREQAKKLLLVLLNGGTHVSRYCPPDWAQARVAAIVEDFRRLSAPWSAFRSKLNKEDPLVGKDRRPTADNQRGALEMQRVERRLLDATLKRVAETAPQVRLLVTMYDGALFDIETRDSASVDAALRVLQQAAEETATFLGYPGLKATVGSGLTWKDAEETQK